MAEWDYDYDNVDTSQVNGMLSDVGIDDVNNYVDSFRNPGELAYYNENGDYVDPSDLNRDDVPDDFYDPYAHYTEEVNVVHNVKPTPPSPSPTPKPAPTPAPTPTPTPAPAPKPGPGPAPGPKPVPAPKPDDAKNTLETIKKYDKNGDGKVAVNDVEALLKDLGVTVLSPKLAQVLFEVVDQNKNGVLDPPELLALAAMMTKLGAKAAAPK